MAAKIYFGSEPGDELIREGCEKVREEGRRNDLKKMKNVGLKDGKCVR